MVKNINDRTLEGRILSNIKLLYKDRDYREPVITSALSVNCVESE